jgi:hypothetical protein
LKDGFNTDNDILTLFSKTVSPFDVTSVPAPIYILAIGNPSSGHAISAINSFSAVAAGPFFNTIVRLEVFSSIGARACSAFVLYNYLLSLFTQIFPSPFVFPASGGKIQVTRSAGGRCRPQKELFLPLCAILKQQSLCQ